MFAYCSSNPVVSIDEAGARTVAVMMTDGGGRGGSKQKKYDRAAAVAYAKEWYNSYNDSYYHYRTDCANFVSQCLAAGGIEQTDEWHMRKTEKTWWYNPLAWFSSNYRYDWDVGAAWRIAPKQYEYFSSQSGNSTIQITSASDITALSAGVQAGDLLYFASDKGIHHATIISKVENGMIYYAGHTYSRFDEPLADNMGSDTVYIIKIGD